MNCEMCGRIIKDVYFEGFVEGSTLILCENCKSCGKFLKEKSLLRSKEAEKKQKKKSNVVLVEEVVENKYEVSREEKVSIDQNYASIIKEARESIDMKQEILAKRIKEKLSIIHHLENGSIEPSIKLAKKLEKELHIVLIKEIDDSVNNDNMAEMLKVKQSPKKRNLTLGDLILEKLKK